MAIPAKRATRVRDEPVITRLPRASTGSQDEDVSVAGGSAIAALSEPRSRVHDEPERLLFIGKEWERKGGPELIAAIDRVHATTRFRPTLDVVGCHPDVDRPYMSAHGPVAAGDMAPFFDRAHVLAMPTRSEAFGVVFVEAVSAGLPVLGSDVGNVPWIVGAAGICPPVGDVDALASALLEMLQSYPQFAELSARRGKEFRATAAGKQSLRTSSNVLGVPVRGRGEAPSRADR